MTFARSAFFLVAFVGALAAASCGTDAKGVSDCRSIEKARCRAAASCGVVADVARCERFYRDQCLHGLPVESPGKVALNGCVSAIEAAGECAKDGPEDASVCAGALTPETACELILAPERLSACSFLSSEPVDESGGSGNSGGSGGESAETSGGAPASGGSGEQTADGGGGAAGASDE